MFYRLIFVCIFSIGLCLVGFLLFSPIYSAHSVIIHYGLHPFDICLQNPDLWNLIKLTFIITYLFSSIIISCFLYSFILIPFIKHIKNIFHAIYNSSKLSHNAPSILSYSSHIFSPKSLQLYVGKDAKTKENLFIPEKSLYQNILITGTIGTGKTSSAMYPFTKQLLCYPDYKIGMLILDVKGNYYKQVLEFAEETERMEDIIIIELGGKYKYNPLHKPHLKANVLANRLKNILLLFSPNQTESYWLDEVEKVLTACIKFCRLYNNGYVTFEEVHKLVTNEIYFKEKSMLIRNKFASNSFSTEEIYDLYTSLSFLQQEFFSLDLRTLSILKSEITRITNCFVSDYDVLRTFCAPLEELNFSGFQDVLTKGKIVILNMNIAEYMNLSKIIAAYLKLDFQSEVMIRLAKNSPSSFGPVAFISDEYSEYCTASDSQFFSQSREAKCINIVATQSYTSLLNTLNNQHATQVIIQNLINKLWFRTDDIYTIENAQKQIGKEDKEKTSTTISENAKETEFSYFTRSLNSNQSSISESINTYTSSEYIYDSQFFTQNLENFSCLAFLSDGTKILAPRKIKLKPYFDKGGIL